MKKDTQTTSQLLQELKGLRKQLGTYKRRSWHIARTQQTALDENEARYHRLLSFLTDYIYTVKVRRGKVIETIHGPGVVAVTGYAAEDYNDNPKLWFDMVYEDDHDLVTEYTSKALAGKNVPPFEHRILRKDGELRWVRNSIVLNKTRRGRLISYDGLINDITEQKVAQELALHQQEQLIQADKMATLGILVTGVAHEINNPNNYMNLNAKMIGKVWEDAKTILDHYYEDNGDFVLSGMHYSQAREKVGELILGIQKGSGRIQSIVTGLKNFARHDPGEMDEIVDVNKVIEDSILIVNNMIKKSTHAFQISLEPNLPKVKGNFQQLEQVVINLMTNACQALPDPEKSLTITTHSAPEKKVAVTVRDEGVGISEEHCKHILDPFFTTKRESGGTGLGLSIAYNIIKAHHGQIHYDSALGKGTTMTVLLPEHIIAS